jgi:anti-sigma B factor antagonist
MPDDRFPIEVAQGVPVVAAPEEIDITNAEALRTALLKVATNGYRTLVVDMTRTQFCDASGLHALAAAQERTLAEGRELLLVIPGTAVLRVFALIGMDRLIPNFASLAEALASTGRRDDQPALSGEPATHRDGGRQQAQQPRRQAEDLTDEPVHP